MIARSPVAGKDAVCIRVCIGVVVFRFIKTRRHHDLMTWNQPHRRFNSYTSILLIEFLSTRTMIKISSHFIPVFILLGDLIISLSLLRRLVNEEVDPLIIFLSSVSFI